MPRSKHKTKVDSNSVNNGLTLMSSSTSGSAADSHLIMDDAVGRLKEVVIQEHIACQNSVMKATHHAVNAGKALLAASMYIGHGEWQKWVAINFSEVTGLTLRTAQRYMAIAREYEKLMATLRARASEGDTSIATDAQLLDGVSIAEALRVVRQLSQSEPVKTPKKLAFDEWLTPSPIVKLAENILGKIACDPCSASGCNNVPAETQLTQTENGLTNEHGWGETAFVSPGLKIDPQQWVERALILFHEERLREAILLLPVATLPTWAKWLRPFPHAYALEALRVLPITGQESKKLNVPAMLVFVGNKDRFSAFGKQVSTSSLFHVFMPYEA